MATMNPVQRIQTSLSHMSRSQRVVAEHVLGHLGDVPGKSITDLATEIGVSEATVIRFCRTVEFTGYRDFQAAMLENRGVLRSAEMLSPDIPADVLNEDSLVGIAHTIAKLDADTLFETFENIPEATLQEAVALLCEADTVYCIGFGSSSSVALDAYQRLMRLGVHAAFTADPHVATSMIVNARRRDTILAVSYSGRSRDVIDVLELGGRRRLRRLLITSSEATPAARASSTVLVTATRRGVTPRESIASRISQLAVIDVVCVGIGLRKGRAAASRMRALESELQRKRARDD